MTEQEFSNLNKDDLIYSYSENIGLLEYRVNSISDIYILIHGSSEKLLKKYVLSNFSLDSDRAILNFLLNEHMSLYSLLKSQEKEYKNTIKKINKINVSLDFYKDLYPEEFI